MRGLLVPCNRECPTLLGGWTLGASHSNEYGQAGGDATISIGGLLLAPIRSIISR